MLRPVRGYPPREPGFPWAHSAAAVSFAAARNPLYHIRNGCATVSALCGAVFFIRVKFSKYMRQHEEMHVLYKGYSRPNENNMMIIVTA